MNITVYKNFKKRKNSTLLPSGGEVVQNVRLKDSVSIERPTFILDRIDFDINYISAFGFYYYVETRTILNNNDMAYICVMDSLSSYKSDISNVSAFVEYSTTLYNEHIKDDRVVTLNTSTIDYIEGSTAGFSNTGYFVLTVASDPLAVGTFTPAGFTTSYILTGTQIRQLANILLTSFNDTWYDALSKVFLKPFDCIVSCKWLPFEYATVTASRCAQNDVCLGAYNTGIRGYVITDNTPLSAVTGIGISSVMLNKPAFKRVSPYTRISAYVPFLGTVEIPAVSVVKENLITFNYGLDIINGDITVNISATDTNEILATYNYNVAVDCPLTASENNLGSVLSSFGSIATNVALAEINPNPISLVGAGTSVANAGMELVSRKTTVKGSIGGRSYTRFGDDTVVIIETVDTTSADPLLQNYGKPYMQVATLGEIRGYIKCADASISCSATPSIRDEINSYLNGGFYLE